jgi:hypothetical protein
MIWMPPLTKTKHLTYKELFCFHVSQQFVPRFCVCVCGSYNIYVKCAEISNTTLFGKQQFPKTFVAKANSTEANPNITM